MCSERNKQRYFFSSFAMGRVRMAPAPFVRVGRYRGLFAAFYRKDGPHGVITEKWPRCCERTDHPVRNLMRYFARRHPFYSHFATFPTFITKFGSFKKPQFRNIAAFEDPHGLHNSIIIVEGTVLEQVLPLSLSFSPSYFPSA